MRELGSGITYNTHNTTSSIRTLKHVSDILQTEEAFTVEEYKHTHTHTKACKVYRVCKIHRAWGRKALKAFKDRRDIRHTI